MIGNLVMDSILEDILTDSNIDYPRKDLDPAVWNRNGNTYILRPEVKNKILDVIKQYPDDLIDMAASGESGATVHIVGSICTNTFLDDCDIDVHIVISEDSNFHGDLEFQSKVMDWFNLIRDEIGGYIEKHPIEVFTQFDPNQDYMSDGVYNLIPDEWLVGPKIEPLTYDPYQDYSHIANDLRNSVEDADKLIGELKRDVIDYDMVKQAMDNLAPDQQGIFLARLKSKLEEIEKDIEDLYGKRREWVDMRRQASKPSTPEEAQNDVELVRKWNDTNAVFKFISRYQYFRVIKDLEKLLADGVVEPNEIDIIKGIVGV